VNRDFADVIAGAATVALTTYAIRWVLGGKGAEAPRSRADVNVYGMKWQVRAVFYLAAVFSAGLAFALLREDGLADGRWPLQMLFAGLALLAFWFGTGAVFTSQNGITKKTLWTSQSLRWDEVSHVQVHKRDGGAIELRGRARKLIVDSRFIAPKCLEKEIEERTKLQLVRD
jgi:hypothetical protein